VNLFFASDKVRIKGALTDYMSHADSGTLMPTGRSARPAAGVRAGTLRILAG
jgi:hypothetical protein